MSHPIRVSRSATGSLCRAVGPVVEHVALLLASGGSWLGQPRAGWVCAAACGLAAGGMFALLFLASQLAACRVQAAGYYAAGNHANAFFYVLTTLHGAPRRRPGCVDGDDRNARS